VEDHQGKDYYNNKNRLYARATFSGFRRAKQNQYEKQALINIDNLKDRTSARWYFGKRVVFIHKSKKGFAVSIFI
jgi:ribosomal protein L35AE/L33A